VGFQRIESVLNFVFVPPSADHLPNIAISQDPFFSPIRRLYEPEANIPAFHFSNWGEAPNLYLSLQEKVKTIQNSSTGTGASQWSTALQRNGLKELFTLFLL